MTDPRWARVKALFQAALEHPATDRAAFVATAAGDDEPLRREVESLLASDAAHDAAVDEWSLPEEDDHSLHIENDRSLVWIDALAATSERQPTPVFREHSRIGPYEIMSPLGAGAMGEVYRARDTRLNRDVALKVLPRTFALDPDRLARFTREAQVLAAVNHPNIAAIYGVEESDGTQALVLELVEGETLADRIARGPLLLAEAIAIGSQIAEALEAAHEKGIIHRDLKPANVKIDGAGLVKLLDFGLAKPVGPAPTHPNVTASHHGLIIGTTCYMSPEQARGEDVDKRADVWAFGCVLYEMLTGRLAFPGTTVSDTIAKILERDPDWSALPKATPAPIRRVLVRCLTKDPRQRLRDIGDARIEISSANDVAHGESDVVDLAPVRPRVWLPWVAALAFAGLLAVRESNRPESSLANPLANATFSRLTDWEGTEGGAQISPDGRFVAFISDREGKFDLWVTQVGTGEFRNLTSAMPSLGAPHSLIRSLGFSGDGAEIWFSVDNDPVLSAKMIVPFAGGSPRPFLAKGDAAPAWSSDGSRLAYFHTGEDPIFVADRTGADARQIAIDPSGQGWTQASERMHNHNPVWSPDDRWLYFVHGFQHQLNWTDEMDAWRVPVSGGTPERLTRHKAAVTFLAPIDTRTFLYVARAPDGAGPWLWALDSETKATCRVSAGLEQYTSIAASRDGRRLVATRIEPTSTLWTVPILDRLAQDQDVQPYRIPTARALAPRFAPRSLLYLSAGGTADGLWRFAQGQAFQIRKSADGALLESPAASRDGSRVAVVLAKEREKRRSLAVMSADGTGLHRIAESIDIQGSVDWSPDGIWIAAGGIDDKLGPGLFKIPVAGGAPVRLVRGPGANPVWSSDGALIVYAGALVTGQVAPLLGVRPDGRFVDLPPLEVRPGGHRFLPDGSGIIYLPRNQSLDFWLLDLASKKTRQLTQLRDQGRLGRFDITPGFDITPDGKQIVFDRSRENADVVLIELPKSQTGS